MNWLLIVLTIISVLLIALILLQKANTDGAESLGGNSFVNSGNKKRGLEKTIFTTTIIVALVFVILNLIAIFVKK